MQKTRRIFQILFFALFIYLFIQAAFPYETFIPSDLFLRADSLVAITTFLSTGHFLLSIFVIAFIILLLTIFLGRFFCGWICPLGTLIDFGDHITSKERKKKSVINRKYRLWKYTILIGVAVAALFSLQFIWFFDPISLITRTFTTVFYPLFAYFAEGIFSILFKMGLFEDKLYSIYDSLKQDSILPIEPIFFRKSIVIFIFFLFIYIAGIVSKRLWCRYVCPLGALYALFSKFRITKRIVNEDCTNCGLCYRNCKMNAINDDFRTYSQFECIECMNCIAICPVNAFEYHVNFHKSPVTTDLSRRRFIYSGIAGLFTVGVIKTGFMDRANAGTVIRPPGSLPEPEFLDRCIRCHECIKICSSTGKYLQPALLQSGWEGIWTPMGDARHGYCEFDCVLCGQVCPTQAIHPIDINTKHQLPIGTAQFDKNRCIPWYRHEDCIVCEEHCPTYEKAIKFEVQTVEKHDGTIKEVKYPYVDEHLCIGCGICVTKCPLVGEAGIFVTSARQQRYTQIL